MTAEEHLQIASMRYIRLQYPDAISFHVANERQTSPMRGAKLKRMGVLAGVPDIHILEARGAHHGLFIELKAPKGRLQPSQKLMIERLRAKGYIAEVCRSFDEVQALVDAYMRAQ